jgi:hypothetical protein
MTILIASKKEGFRRCGVAHSIALVEHPDDRFTADELERLLFEPMLTVVAVPNEAGDDAGKSDDADKYDDAGETGNAGESGAAGESGKSEPKGEEQPAASGNRAKKAGAK